MKIVCDRLWLLWAFVALCGGCATGRYSAIPGVDRTGEFYRYSRHYWGPDSMRFSLLGRYVGENFPNSEKLTPSIDELCIGLFFVVPLRTVEGIGICPILDTLLLPYDASIR